MALVRALNSAVSGLRSMQFGIDNIGDNLANSTTTAFKAGRVNFHTLLSQTISFGTAPSGFLGGVDPQQMGLGVAVAETSKDFRQGELEVTGIASDLGIEGNGFFIMRDAAGAFVYSRDGSFTINPSNLLHNPANGQIVQGVNADLSTFTITPGGPLENIEIPVGNLQIARATSVAEFDGNLNGAGDKALLGSVLESGTFVSGFGGPAVTSATPLTALFRQPPTPGPDIDMALDLGDTITLNVKKGGRTLSPKTFILSATPVIGTDGYGTTVGELITFMRRAMGINPGNSEILYGAIRDDDLNPNTPGINAVATLAGPGSAILSAAGNIIGVVASGTNFLAQGVQAGLDVVVFQTGDGAGQRAIISSIGTTSTLNDTLFFQTFLPTNIPIPEEGDAFTVHEPPRVSLGGFPSAAGRLRVAGNVGTINNFTDLTLLTSDGINMTPFTTIETADGESGLTNATIFDALGSPHVVELSFVLETKGGTDPSTTVTGNTFRFYAENEDNLAISGPGGSTIVGTDRIVGTGTVTFTTGGAFAAQNPGAAVNLQLPNNGTATPLTVSPDFSGLTGFADVSSSVFLIEQDGFQVGVLNDFSIGQDGVVTGIFSNGITRPLAQVIMARFANNNGLRSIGSNNFVQAANSGPAITGQPGTIGLGTIRSGVLEASNVDLAREFTRLIVHQRSFQADARVITTADRLLEELVNIV